MNLIDRAGAIGTARVSEPHLVHRNFFLNVTIDRGGEVLLPVQWRELPALLCLLREF